MVVDSLMHEYMTSQALSTKTLQKQVFENPTNLRLISLTYSYHKQSEWENFYTTKFFLISSSYTCISKPNGKIFSPTNFFHIVSFFSCLINATYLVIILNYEGEDEPQGKDS